MMTHDSWHEPSIPWSLTVLTHWCTVELYQFSMVEIFHQCIKTNCFCFLENNLVFTTRDLIISNLLLFDWIIVMIPSVISTVKRDSQKSTRARVYTLPINSWGSLHIFYYIDMISHGSVSVYQAGGPSSLSARSACVRKVEFYHCAIDLHPPLPTTGSKKAVHVLLCLCNNACKRSLAICRKSRALCLVSRLLSVPIWPACVKQGR